MLSSIVSDDLFGHTIGQFEKERIRSLPNHPHVDRSDQGFARSLHVTNTNPCSSRNLRNSALLTIFKSR
jgi:hypothetical protein